ncbi:hypothetical protein ACHAXH_002286 [Discostella pseudostelligera]
MQLVDNENITQSPHYIRQKGLPVLHIYGFGFKAVNVDDTARVSSLIKWYAPEKYRVFLINGAPSEWRELGGDSRPKPAWLDIYNSFDGIHPWHVGRWDSTSKFDSYYANIIFKDAAYCKEKGILYMPTMWPGFSWYNLKQNSTLTPPAKLNSIPREGGKFFWKQAHAFAANSNITTIWLAQIDEIDEGTAILKVAAKTSDLPVQGKWLPLDIDGQSVPSDWYLRLGGEAQKMFEGTRPLSSVIPIKPTDPPPPDALVNISANINDSNSTGNRGILFTITAKQNIFIRGLDIVARRTNAPSMSIYTRSGSYNNATFTMDGWQQIFQTRIRSSQFGNDKNILKLDDVNVKVQIRAGQTQSFYIYNSNGLRFKPGANEGGPHFEDDAIVVNEGRMTKSFFGNATVIGQFSGVSHIHKFYMSPCLFSRLS